MSTRRLGEPAVLRRQLEYVLPRLRGDRPAVQVTPRDAQQRRSAAWSADHYEVHAFYVGSDPEALGPLEEALAAVPSVYLTTQVRWEGANVFTNPDWPTALGTARRNRGSLRNQVIALIRDAEEDQQ